MELDKFIADFTEQFEDTDSSVFTKDTVYKNLDEWTSLQTLLIIGMVDEEYDVRVNGEEINQKSTIKDLFELVKSKK